MPQIDVDDRTYRELELLAAAWHTTIAEAVDRLVIKMAARATVGVGPVLDHLTVHAFYNGTRIEAIFERETHAVTVCSGPLSGHTFASPVDAEDALCDLLNLNGEAVAAGWTSWMVTESGVPLDLLAGYHLRGFTRPPSHSSAEDRRADREAQP